MSIQEWANRLCADGTLFRIVPYWPGLQRRREFYATDIVNRLLVGPWVDQQEEERANELRYQVDRFLDGERIWVRPDCDDGTDASFARLKPPADEVWEMRSLKPKPSLRIFGRFIARDRFVAMNWAKRIDLGAATSQEWVDAIQLFHAQWQRYFATCPPHSPQAGSFPNGYLSNARLI
jgi:hypothetical protein